MGQCPKCGAILASSADRYCLNCGAELTPEPGVPPPLPPPAATEERFRSGPGTGGPGPAGTPWDRRDQLGFVPAIFDTVKGVLGSPSEFFRAMPKEGGIGGPLAYGMLLGYLGLLLATLYQTMQTAMLGPLFAQLGDRAGPFGRLPGLLEGGVNLVAQVLLGPIWILIGLFLASAIYHLVLLLLGQARSGFETTFRVVCFGQSTAVLQVVPFCGGLLAIGAWIWVGIIGLSEAHGIGRGPAAIAVLAPLVLCCCCCGIAAALFFGGVAGMAGRYH